MVNAVRIAENRFYSDRFSSILSCFELALDLP